MKLKNLASSVRTLINSPDRLYNALKRMGRDFNQDVDDLKFIHGQELIYLQKILNTSDIHESEFKIFSQFGNDGIIQWIISKIGSQIPHTFIEFGVENYEESNTRFLLMHDNWKGLIIDGSQKNIDHVKHSSYYWKNDVTAVSEFITRENINKIFTDNKFSGEIGILSIDIDGNDYWIWKEINSVSPCVLICEYNSVFGGNKKVTIPYNEKFYRANYLGGGGHFSYLYWGASISAFTDLSEKKGYSCIGSDSVGNSVFFVRNDFKNYFKVMTSSEAYVESKIRESRDENGKLNFLSGSARLEAIKDMPIYDIDQDKILKISELYEM